MSYDFENRYIHKDLIFQAVGGGYFPVLSGSLQSVIAAIPQAPKLSPIIINKYPLYNKSVLKSFVRLDRVRPGVSRLFPSA